MPELRKGMGLLLDKKRREIGSRKVLSKARESLLGGGHLGRDEEKGDAIEPWSREGEEVE